MVRNLVLSDSSNMDIKIPHSWLTDFLSTKAGSKKIAEALSLCGPSVENVEKVGSEYVYNIEITTNRIDSAGVYGIAREASAILPRFKQKTALKPYKTKSKKIFVKKVDYLKVKVDHKLAPRFTAILIKDVKIASSPKYIKDRLTAVGVRPINNIVDISNYVMHELGQPIHTFDYDKIKGAKMVLRKSIKGEEIETLDGETHKLPGGDIVIEDGEKRLIDLAGIMGGKLSEVDKNTKNVLLFVQTYDAATIRRTAMKLAKRTDAASIFEKGLDTELVTQGVRRGIDLFVELTKGKPANEILDLYPNPYKAKTVRVKKSFIDKQLDINLGKSEISSYLKPLGFETRWKSDTLFVGVPSFRSNDVNVKEDIIEEIARIYGYHDLPSKLMEGPLPEPTLDTPFKFENELKTILTGLKGNEVYTLSLVGRSYINGKALKIKNPLGPETEYLRTSLKESLVAAAFVNTNEKDPFHLFEISNVYLPKVKDLPAEKLTLAGIFYKYKYRKAKGVVETLLNSLNINPRYQPEDSKGFTPSHRLLIKAGNDVLGEFGSLEKEDYIYYEFDVVTLKKHHKPSTYKVAPKYPAQIEDLTFVLPKKTKVGDLIIKLGSSNNISKVILKDIYNDAYTFRVWYQDLKKTLSNKDVDKIRDRLIVNAESGFGAKIKY